jgi:hypothetical protein
MRSGQPRQQKPRFLRPLARVRVVNLTTNLAIWQQQTKTKRGLRMTRGRRKDTTVPPSRALAIQRAYRDRKAKYVSDLEDRCRKAEEENERLRNELELARSESAPSIVDSELVSRSRRKIPKKERTTTYFYLFKLRVGSGVL